jgi:hypothetical protein
VQIEKIEKLAPAVMLKRHTGAKEARVYLPVESPSGSRPRHLRLGGGCRRPVVTPRSTVWISGGERGPSPSRWPLQAVLPIDVSYSGMKLYLSDH